MRAHLMESLLPVHSTRLGAAHSSTASRVFLMRLLPSIACPTIPSLKPSGFILFPFGELLCGYFISLFSRVFLDALFLFLGWIILLPYPTPEGLSALRFGYCFLRYSS